MIILSPTKKGIRVDRAGDGHYGASRNQGRRTHRGVDYICSPGQSIVAPITGRIIREAWPYAKDRRYTGFLIRNGILEIKVFYCKLLPGMVGRSVNRGDDIAVAQNIAQKYKGGMIPHVHLEITNINPELFMGV